jgi:hypothetical protein
MNTDEHRFLLPRAREGGRSSLKNAEKQIRFLLITAVLVS